MTFNKIRIALFFCLSPWMVCIAQVNRDSLALIDTSTIEFSAAVSAADMPRAVLNIENDSDFTGFGLLDSFLEKYKVFFVGENHTFRETNSKLELKMFKYLYHKAGVRNLFFELGYSRGWLVDKYVQTGDTAIYNILENYSYEAYAELYKGLMEFNRTLDSSKKIRIIGLDVERFYELSTKVLSMILPKTEAPREISLHIESLEGLAGYFDKYLRESRNDTYSSRYSAGNYSAAATINAIIKNFNDNRDIYKTYLGEDFGHFEIIIHSLEIHDVWDKYDEDKMVQEYVYREQYLYQQFQKVLEMYPDEKFFGQFGRCHVATAKQKEACNWYEYNSVASRINNSRNPSVHNKVFSIACFYPKSNQYDELVDENTQLRELEEFAPEDSLTLFVLQRDTSDKDIQLTDRYNCIIINNTPQESRTFAKDTEYTKQKMRIYTSATYGQRFIDFNGLNAVFQSMGDVSLNNMVQQWGFHSAVTYASGAHSRLGYSFFSPIKKPLNDSTEVSLSGSNIFMYGGKDLIRNRLIDIIPSLGIGFGNLKLLVSQANQEGSALRGFFGENNKRIYRNPALLADLALNININLKFLSLGIYGNYMLDLSRQKWHISDTILNESTKTSLSGYNAGVSLGILIDN